MTALMLTLAVEAPLIGWYAHRRCWSWGRALAAGLLPSLLTHPLAWQMGSRLGPSDFFAGVAIIETVVWVIETALLRILLALQWRQAWMLSLLANAASATLGWLLPAGSFLRW